MCQITNVAKTYVPRHQKLIWTHNEDNKSTQKTNVPITNFPLVNVSISNVPNKKCAPSQIDLNTQWNNGANPF